MLTEAQLLAILQTPEAERTAEQKQALADHFAAANRKPESDDKKDKNLITIEQAFEHPRFKELVQAAKDAKTRADALEQAAQAAEKKRLEEAQDFKKLYEQAQAEITNLRPKAESLGEMETTLKSVLDVEIATLPEQFRDVVPDGTPKQQLEWLSKHKQKFMKPEAFDIGAGAKGAKKPDEKAAELSEEEKVAAQSLGMTVDEYKKYKDPNATPA